MARYKIETGLRDSGAWFPLQVWYVKDTEQMRIICECKDGREDAERIANAMNLYTA